MSDLEKTQPVEENEAAMNEETFEYDRTLCCACQKHERAAGSYYCEECRTKMMKTKIKGGAIFAAVLCVIISLCSIILLGANATQMVDLLEADTLAQQGYINAALNKVSEATDANSAINDSDTVQSISDIFGGQTIFTLGYGESVTVARIYATGYTEMDAGGYLISNLTEETVKSEPRLLGVKKYVDEYNSLVTVQEKAYALLQDYSTAAPEDVPFDELVEKLDALKGEDGVKDQYIDYYKCYVAMIADKGEQVQLDYLLSMEEKYPEGTLIYGPTIADCYYRLGDYGKTVEYANKMIAKNRNYSEAYEQKLMALLADNKLDDASEVCDELTAVENVAGVSSGDYTSYSLRAMLYWYTGKYDEAIKVCDEGIEVSDGDVDIYRNQAIAYLLKGDYEKANNSAQASFQFAMNYGSLTLDIINTAALTAGLAKDTESYEALEEYLETYNMEVSSVVKDCLAGKKTVEEIFITDGGVIS